MRADCRIRGGVAAGLGSVDRGEDKLGGLSREACHLPLREQGEQEKRNQVWLIRGTPSREGGGGGVLDIMHGRSRMTVDPRIPTFIPAERICTSIFHHRPVTWRRWDELHGEWRSCILLCEDRLFWQGFFSFFSSME